MVLPTRRNTPLSYFSVEPDQERHHWNWHPGHPRVFIHQFDSVEHRSLHYILENLSQKTLVTLWPIQNELKKKGDALEHIHPLAFFMHILSHHHLRSYFHKLKGKNNKAWKEFVNGASKSFREEQQKQNIQDHHIEHFCHRTGKDLHYVRHLMHHHKWEDFIKYL